MHNLVKYLVTSFKVMTIIHVTFLIDNNNTEYGINEHNNTISNNIGWLMFMLPLASSNYICSKVVLLARTQTTYSVKPLIIMAYDNHLGQFISLVIMTTEARCVICCESPPMIYSFRCKHYNYFAFHELVLCGLLHNNPWSVHDIVWIHIQLNSLSIPQQSMVCP